MTPSFGKATVSLALPSFAGASTDDDRPNDKATAEKEKHSVPNPHPAVTEKHRYSMCTAVCQRRYSFWDGVRSQHKMIGWGHAGSGLLYPFSCSFSSLLDLQTRWDLQYLVLFEGKRSRCILVTTAYVGARAHTMELWHI